MPEPQAFSYAIIRVVPRVERGEFLNVGAVLFCKTLGFLQARVELREAPLLALCPDVDLPTVREHLDAFLRICAGEADAGPIAQLPPQERFYWLTAVRSTMIQTSPLHSGVTDDPAAVLTRVMEQMVR